MQPKVYYLQIENIFFLSSYHILVFVSKLRQNIRTHYPNTYLNILKIFSDLIYVALLNFKIR